MKSNDRLNSEVKMDMKFTNYETHLKDQCALHVLNGLVMQRPPTDDAMRASYAKLALAMADTFMAVRNAD